MAPGQAPALTKKKEAGPPTRRGTTSGRALLHHAVLCRTAGVAEKFPQPAKMVVGSGHKYPRGSDGDCV
ncbi:hypothetical protein MRX96_025860 [Rhipicephalus microplus]